MNAIDKAQAVDEFQQFFPGNPSRHGRFLGLDTATGKKQVDTRADQPVTLEMIEQHLGASDTVTTWGLVYLPGHESGTPCGLIDLDDKDFPGEQMDATRSAVLKTCTVLGLSVYPERSSRGRGWHLWLFADALLPYDVMRDALRAILRHAAIKAEVYPMGETPTGRLVIMPYRDALHDPNRLGKTWLVGEDGQPIPVDELGKYITLNSAQRLQALAIEDPPHIQAATAKQTDQAVNDETGDLSAGAVALLLEVAVQQAPLGGRHDALAAFLNLGQRAGDLDGMAVGLKSAEVLRVWCPDGSRTAQDWEDEVDRWVKNLRSGEGGQRRGLTYLREEAGYSVPSLPKRHNPSGLPEIVVNERHLREIAADIEKVLIDANNPPVLFRRGGELVRLTVNEGETRLKPLDTVALKGVMDRVANFVNLGERTKNGEIVTDRKPARPPADLAPDMLTRVEHLNLPVLRTLAHSPIYDPGGKLISAEGYHAGSAIYLALRQLSVPELPTVPDALALLGELLTDFPFSPHEAGFAHTLAALLLPFVRPMIDGPTPLHLIEAPTRGSGKGLLSEVIAHVTVGGPAGVMVQPKNGDEFEKRVTSILLEGAPVVLLDNVHTLKGEALAAVLTTPMWRGRRLGKTEMLTLPNGALWLATGNNVSLDDDMPRRIIPIRLDPGVERPEERSGFRHPDLLAWIKVNRPALVAACLSLVEAWKAAGSPRGSARMGSFESWTATIGGILEVAGVPGFLTARDGLYETANTEPQEWVALLTDLHGRHGGETIGAREIMAAMMALNLCSDYWEGKQRTSALKRVGKAVSARRDRVFGGHRIRIAGRTASGNVAYRVETAGQGSKKIPETPKTPETGEETATSTAFLQDSVSEQTPGVPGVFAGNTGQTLETHRVLPNLPDGAEGVSGVFGVINRPDSDAGDAVEL